MDIIGGTPAALIIPFVIGDQSVAPDVGSVTYTVKDQFGAPLTGLVDVPYVTTTTSYQMQILIPSSAHTIASGRRFERRSVTVNFTLDGGEVQLNRAYRVVPEFSHTITPDQVRGFIGIEKHEMPDDQIDLTAAYLAVELVVGQSELTAALTSGTTQEIAANTLINMRAVLDVLPSAKQRMAQSEKNGVKEFSRVDLKELDKLADEARRRYQDALDEIVVITETSISLFLTTDGTDAITG